MQHIDADHRLAAIKAFIVYAATMDITVAANLTKLDKIPKKKPAEVSTVEYMSEAAVSAILEAPDVSTGKGLRDRCLMILMYDTGARVQEIIDIKLCDFRFSKTPTVTLHSKGGKTRTVPIMDKTVEHLKQYTSLFHGEANVNSDYCFSRIWRNTIFSVITSTALGRAYLASKSLIQISRALPFGLLFNVRSSVCRRKAAAITDVQSI